MTDLVQTFDIAADRTRVGIVVYSDEPKLSIGLNDHETKDDLIAALQNIEYLRGELRQNVALSRLNIELQKAYCAPTARFKTWFVFWSRLLFVWQGGAGIYG